MELIPERSKIPVSCPSLRFAEIFTTIHEPEKIFQRAAPENLPDLLTGFLEGAGPQRLMPLFKFFLKPVAHGIVLLVILIPEERALEGYAVFIRESQTIRQLDSPSLANIEQDETHQAYRSPTPWVEGQESYLCVQVIASFFLHGHPHDIPSGKNMPVTTTVEPL
ncbi:MAG: hypothetical protein CMN03_02100 [Roseibacillus sp.]|nr:hypothetical protein [Roseibacillus sp.]